MLINLQTKIKLGFVLGACKRSNYQLELEEQLFCTCLDYEYTLQGIT